MENHHRLKITVLNQIPLTIRSRSFEIKVSTPNLNETLEWLKDYPEEDSLKAIKLSNNLPIVAKEFLDNNLIGGSADLAGSNNTKTKHHKIIKPSEFDGNYIHYGVREHAMSGIMNGLALHSNFIPYGGTFLIFSDYCKPSIRLSALMQQRVIYVMTHDSIGLGEDGPTHQPCLLYTSPSPRDRG